MDELLSSSEPAGRVDAVTLTFLEKVPGSGEITTTASGVALATRSAYSEVIAAMTS